MEKDKNVSPIWPNLIMVIKNWFLIDSWFT